MILPTISRDVLREALLDAAAVLMPVDCAGCGAPDRGLCSECRAALGASVETRALGHGLPVTSALRYAGDVGDVVLALKRDGRIGVARALGPALGAAVEAALDAAGVPEHRIRIVPVPPTRRAYRRRGFDPVRLLLARAGVPAWRVFAPAASHRTQKLLGASDRARNLRGAFRVQRDAAGARILLIDDVVTTGATLREAASALREAGAEVVGAAVLASTPLRSGFTAHPQLPNRDIRRGAD